MTGNTGTLYRQFMLWNVAYNSYICSGSTSGVTDGNGIILEQFGDQFGSGGVAYVGGALVAFNVVYNNGSYGIPLFNSQYVTFANNSIFNNSIQAGNTNQTWRGNLDSSGAYAINSINNVVYAGCGSGALASNSAIGILTQIVCKLDHVDRGHRDYVVNHYFNHLACHVSRRLHFHQCQPGIQRFLRVAGRQHDQGRQRSHAGHRWLEHNYLDGAARIQRHGGGNAQQRRDGSLGAELLEQQYHALR